MTARKTPEKHDVMRSRVLIGTFAFFVGLFSACAEEPFFKKGDVIALVGGEDMVAMSEYGYLELLLTRALPEHRLKFRNLAWEGDTVFEQRRDLNFPPLEAQLDQVGATVIICQFGQMESFAGKEKVPDFSIAYEKLLAWMASGGKRRVVVLGPFPLTDPPPTKKELDQEVETGRKIGKREQEDQVGPYYDAAKQVAKKAGFRFLPLMDEINTRDGRTKTSDGIHLSRIGHGFVAPQIGEQLHAIDEDTLASNPMAAVLLVTAQRSLPLRELITAKNRLWFDYWRVQNWAFLAGDRTEQPSSRDHLDRTKRWFPAEREQFLPLIEKKEQEIWDLAAKLASPAAASK